MLVELFTGQGTASRQMMLFYDDCLKIETLQPPIVTLAIANTFRARKFFLTVGVIIKIFNQWHGTGTNQIRTDTGCKQLDWPHQQH